MAIYNVKISYEYEIEANNKKQVERELKNCIIPYLKEDNPEIKIKKLKGKN